MSNKSKGCDFKRQTNYKDNRCDSNKSCNYNSDCNDSDSLECNSSKFNKIKKDINASKDEIDILKSENFTLKERVDRLEKLINNMFLYQPDGEGYNETKEHFKNIQTSSQNEIKKHSINIQDEP